MGCQSLKTNATSLIDPQTKLIRRYEAMGNHHIAITSL